ncbi:hypothetical protein D3C85_14990 [compost metagenome]
MENKHTLGRVEVKAGEILTFTYDNPSPENRRHITVVALSDINLSDEMALFYQELDRGSDDIITEAALPAFIEHLCDKRLLHVGTEVNIHIGTVGRPAERLVNEYKFMLNPESFWEEKLSHRYLKRSFTVYSHQDHLLTIMMGVEAPFTILADIINMQGNHLGILQLSILSDRRHTLISDDDLERIRSALQADISLCIDEVSVLVERVTLLTNPDFGSNRFTKYLSVYKPEPEIEKDLI